MHGNTAARKVVIKATPVRRSVTAPTKSQLALSKQAPYTIIDIWARNKGEATFDF